LKSSNLTIDAEFQGEAGLGASVVRVGATGRVEADIFAQTIEVLGTVVGNLTATDVIRLRERSTVRGNLKSRRIEIEDGACVHGAVDMDQLNPASSPSSSH
jgi:cytoskeletal protein CcmA (bactofilin family)